MLKNEDSLTEDTGITSAEIIRAGLDDKVRAIISCEEIIWKIRSGYIALLYGAITFILGTHDSKGAPPDICALMTKEGRTSGPAVALFILIFGLSLSVFLIDFGYVRKKLKIVVARDKLVEIACQKAFNIKNESNEMKRLLHVAGETAPHKLPDGLFHDYVEKRHWNLWSILLPIYVTTPILAILIFLACLVVS